MSKRGVRVSIVIVVVAIAHVAGCRPRVTPAPTAPARRCTADEVAEIVEPATAGNDTINITCSTRLDPAIHSRVTKRLHFVGPAASGVTFDCGGVPVEYTPNVHGSTNDNMILVASNQDGAGTWRRPHDVTIRNCEVFGTIRVRGIDVGLLPDMSDEEGYVQRVRDAAPTRITFDRLTLRHCGGRDACASGGRGKRDNAFYLHQGVNRVTLQRSTIAGNMRGVPIYFTSETYGNVVRDSYIHATSGREKIAVDGSSDNRFINNRFAALETGGIYIYRNCGENGMIRHTKPSHNHIINNAFYYGRYTGPEAAVLFGGRGYMYYCPDDWDIHGRWPTSSQSDDRNYARDNVAVQNQIFERATRDMIRTGSWPFDGSPPDPTSMPNVVDFNETVTAETVMAVGSDWPTGWSEGRTPAHRQAGCYDEASYKPFLLDGESVDVILLDGRPVCSPYRKTCDDGELVQAPAEGCSLATADFGCVGTTNEGCTGAVSCPAPTRVVGAVAACDLETGSETSVADTAIADRFGGSLRVLRASDNAADGACSVGTNTISTGSARIRGIVAMNGAAEAPIRFGCREHDANGGECQIRGKLYCR